MSKPVTPCLTLGEKDPIVHRMFPIRDHNPSERTPIVTYAIMAINIVVFLSYWPFLTTEYQLAQFFDTWAMRPVEITHGVEQYTIITSMFLHGGWMHIIGNMLFLYIFGDNLEDEMGHVGFALFYLASGIGAALAQIMIDPQSPVPMVGASGAIAGVMGGYLLLFPKARVDVLIIFIVLFYVLPVPAWVMLGLWFAFQFINGFGAADAGVAYWAHVGGFAAGLALALPLFLRLGGPAFWGRTFGRPPHPPMTYETRRSSIPQVRRKRK